MPLAMNREVFITCAVTGSGGSQDRSPHVPRSPKQIADSAIEAAKAGVAAREQEVLQSFQVARRRRSLARCQEGLPYGSFEAKYGMNVPTYSRTSASGGKARPWISCGLAGRSARPPLSWR